MALVFVTDMHVYNINIPPKLCLVSIFFV